MARPRLTDEVTDKVCAQILAGNTDRVAAVRSGISYSTLRQWLVKGESGKRPYAEFFEAVECARAEIEARMVAAAYSPEAPDPESARAWLVKRRVDWRESKQLEVSGEVVTRVVFRLPEVGEGDGQDD